MRCRNRCKVGLLVVWIAIRAGDWAWAQEPAGAIRVVVMDADAGGVLAGANVQVLELGRTGTSDRDGVVFFDAVRVGEYTVVVTKPGYERRVAGGVKVTQSQMAEVAVALPVEVTEMEEMVVRSSEPAETSTEAGLLQLREATVSMRDAISGELLRRAGASDVAGALRLVVGTSVEEGKYATVRGLGDRYVGASLNGIRVPSADPKRRSVHMDLFPAGTIKSLTVYKTYTPDLPGDYSGGGILIETIGIPDEPFLKLSFSREYDPLVTGRENFLSYERPAMDPWARDRGHRRLPEVADNMEGQDLLGSLDSYHERPAGRGAPHDPLYVKYDRITRSFTPVIGVQRDRAGPNWTANIALGDRGTVLGGVWGVVGALNYGRRYQMQTGTDTGFIVPVVGSAADKPTSMTREVGTEELRFSQLFAAGVGDGQDDMVTVLGLRNRVATDRASIRRSIFNPEVEDTFAVEQALHYVERSLNALQFRGRHSLIEPSDALFGLRLDWHAARNITEQDEPDVRFFRNYVMRQDDGTWMHLPVLPGSSGAPQDRSTRIWRNTLEKNSQLGLNVELPFERRSPSPATARWIEGEGRVRFGLSRDWTHREYSQQSYFYEFAGQRDPTYTGPVYSSPPYPRGRRGREMYERDYTNWLNSTTGQLYQAMMAEAARDRTKAYWISRTPDELWSDVFLSSDRIGVGRWQNSMYWYIRPRLNDVSYVGEQEFHAGYAMIEFPIARQLTVMVGSRAENTYMRVEPRSDVDQIEPARAYLVPVMEMTTNRTTGRVIRYYTIVGVPRDEARAEIEDSRWLPAASLTLELAPGMRLRGSWSQTIARPTFLEIAPIITYDFIEGEALIGNKDLTLSEVTNWDLRWEWIRSQELYALSWFRKEIRNPIEKETFGYLSRDYMLAVNYPEGSVHGIEAEFRRRLDFLPWPGEHLTLIINYTRIFSEVELPEAQQVSLAEHGIERTHRDMEGQPDYLFNVGIMLDFERTKTSAGLFYNRRGETLRAGAAVGDRGARPDIYILPYGSLNFTLSQKLGPFTLGLKLSNLTREAPVEVYRLVGAPDLTRRQYAADVLTSFSISYEF